MIKTILSFSIFATFASPFLRADEPDVKFVMETAKPVEIHYADGRIAQWLIGTKRAVHFPTQFRIAENTCTPKENAAGRFFFAFQQHILAPVWSKHPAPEKIGSTIKLKFKSSSTSTPFELVDVNFLTSTTKTIMPIASREVGTDYIEGTDFSWLPGGGTEPPQSIVFTRWDSESMVTNPETGLMENRTNGIAMKVLFTKIQPNRLELTDMKHFFGNQFAFFLGDIWSIILKTEDGFCQISQKANLGDVLMLALQYLAEPATFTPYLFGADEYSTFAMPALFKAYYNNWKNYDAE